jgi:hypothetical protein
VGRAGFRGEALRRVRGFFRGVKMSVRMLEIPLQIKMRFREQ